MKTIQLSPVAQDIFDAVIEAMQNAEEIGGPEGAEYSLLMEKIASEANERRKNAADIDTICHIQATNGALQAM